MRGRLHTKVRKFRLSFALFQYSDIPFLPFPTYPTILCKFFHTCEKRLTGVRIIVVFYLLLLLLLLLLFLIFVCIKGYPSSDFGPSKENFM